MRQRGLAAPARQGREGEGRAARSAHCERKTPGPLASAPVKVLIVSLYFPPAGGGGVQRPLKFATHLPALGIETHVLAPDDPRWIHTDDELEAPTQAWVHRARNLGPRGRRPAHELHGTAGLERASLHAQLLGRRLLVPDENVL